MKSVKIIWFLVAVVLVATYMFVEIVVAGALPYLNQPYDLKVTKTRSESLKMADICNAEGLEWTSGNPCLIKVTVDNGTGLQLNTYNPQQAGCNEQR